MLDIPKILPATCNNDYGFDVPIPKYPFEVSTIVWIKLLDVEGSASPKRIPPVPDNPF